MNMTLKRSTWIVSLAVVMPALSWAQPQQGGTRDASISQPTTQLEAALAAPTQMDTQQKVVPTPTGQTDVNPVVAPVPTVIPGIILKIGELRKFDKLNFVCPNWNIGCISVGDTILRDAGEFRTALAKKNLMFFAFAQTGYGDNMLRVSPPQTAQLFNYERPQWGQGQFYWLTYNIPSKNIQVVVGGNQTGASWAGGVGPNTDRFNDMYFHQSLFKDKLSYSIGYDTNDTVVYGGYVAGSLAVGALGEKAIIPYALGMAYSPFMAPSFHIKYSFKSGLYGIALVQRSTDPRGIEYENGRDELGLRLFPHGDGALYMPEIGYRKYSSPEVKATWFRATGFYNASHFQDYSSVQAVVNGTKGHNGAETIGLDRQITQPDKILSYRGIYVNAMAQYAVPDMNVYHQYYQAALYSFGLIRRRPLDIMIVDANRTQFSRTALNTLQQLPSSAGQQVGRPTYDDSTSYAAVYGLHIRPGMILGPNFTYAVHPAFAPKLPNAFTGAVELTLQY